MRNLGVYLLCVEFKRKFGVGFEVQLALIRIFGRKTGKILGKWKKNHKKKKIKKKIPVRDFRDFGPAAEGNTTNFFFWPNRKEITLSSLL
jgi:hypothetical protein